MKPKRSYLQKLASEVNWFVGCRLHTISSASLPIQSHILYKKLEAYNEAVKDLQKATKARYKIEAKYHRENVV